MAGSQRTLEPWSDVSEPTGAFAANARRKSWRCAPLAAAALLGWALGVGWGMKAVYDHSGVAGRDGDVPRRFPADAAVPLDRERPTLVLLAHPRCPCTKASIGELAELMRRLDGRVAAHVLFVKPEGVERWAPPELWSSAARIPGVSVSLDPGGREAARLGAKTSGQVVLYAPAGKLLFAGGITPSRGHLGDNAGVDRIVSLVEHGEADRASSSVFGCSIFGEEGP